MEFRLIQPSIGDFEHLLPFCGTHFSSKNNDYGRYYQNVAIYMVSLFYHANLLFCAD